MPDYSVTTRHLENMAFESHIGLHRVRMDTSVEGGGADSGPSPKKLLLGTLAGCTGIDVVSLLQKMRVPFSNFDIVTDADLTEELPRVFSRISILYRIRVAPQHQSKVEKAVALSKEKYCGISAMLQKNSPIEYGIEFLP